MSCAAAATWMRDSKRAWGGRQGGRRDREKQGREGLPSVRRRWYNLSMVIRLKYRFLVGKQIMSGSDKGT